MSPGGCCDPAGALPIITTNETGGISGGLKGDEEEAAAPERALELGQAMLKALQPPSASASRFHRFQAAGVTAIPGRAVTHTCQGPAGAGDAEKGLSSLAGSSLPSTGGQGAAARGGGCGERGCRRFVWAGSPHVPPAGSCEPPQLCPRVWGAVSPHGWGSSRGLQHCSPLGLYLPLPAASHQST